MKIVCDVIRYQYKQYVFSSKWVMPIALLIAFIASFYSIAPLEIVNSFAITGLVLFAVMVWVGVTTQELKPEVSEQIMILRLKSALRYYICHIMFLACLCVISVVVSMGIPLLKNILQANALFSRKTTFLDVIGGFSLLFSCAFTGVMLGELFHARIIKERTTAVFITFASALFAIVRSGLIEEYPVSKFVAWVVPPVSDVVSWFSNALFFDVGKLAGGVSLLMLYAVIMAVIKVVLLCRRKF